MCGHKDTHTKKTHVDLNICCCYGHMCNVRGLLGSHVRNESAQAEAIASDGFSTDVTYLSGNNGTAVIRF